MKASLPLRWPSTLSVCAALGAGVAGCSSGDYSVETPLDRLNPPAVQRGVFKPGRVSGLDFVSDQQSGVTDANGQYTCESGQPVRFALGNLELGATACATLAHPAALVASGELTDPSTLNMTRLLLFLDSDELPANGISISPALRSLAESWAPVDFAAADFDQQIVQIAADVASVEPRADQTLPSSTAAYEYLYASLSCAYSGVFVNFVAAGAFNALTNIALSVYRQPDGEESFFVQIKRNHPQSQFYLADIGSVELRALPILLEDTLSGSGDVSGEFITPDRVAGAWENAVSIQPVDATGSFVLLRLGGALGEYRIVGTYRPPVGLDGPVPPVGHFALALDGETISGDAFEIANGLLVSVRGRRLPDLTRVELTVEPLGVTSEAELVLDASGVPIALDGEWPGLPGSTLDTFACRL